MIEFVVSIAAALISLLAGGVASSDVFKKLILKLLGKKAPPKTYAERLSELTANLTKASAEVDQVITELAQVSKDREKAVRDLETGLGQLEKREKELKEKIEILQNVPLQWRNILLDLLSPARREALVGTMFCLGQGLSSLRSLRLSSNCLREDKPSNYAVQPIGEKENRGQPLTQDRWAGIR